MTNAPTEAFSVRARRAADRAVDLPLHPWRRRRLLRRLSRFEGSSTLFLCLGNVCRSPYAERSFQRMLQASGLDWLVSSAGLIGPGRASPESALAAAARRGIDLSGHRSRLIGDVAQLNHEMVVVMSADQARKVPSHPGRPLVVVMGDLDPQWGTRRTIPDPWGKSDRDFDEAYERIDRCLYVLMQVIVSANDRSKASTDLSYRRNAHSS